MGIKKQPDIHVCDRCGHETISAHDQRGMLSGCTGLDYIGHRSTQHPDGRTAKNTHKGEAWLCCECTDKFLKFMEGE